MKKRFMAAFLLLSLSYSNSLTAQDNDSLTRIYSKFDFIPGEKVILMIFLLKTSATFLFMEYRFGEIVTYSVPGKWLKITIYNVQPV
jgi:hypothetical protein